MNPTHSTFTLTVVALVWLAAMSRVTRLITADVLTQPVRDWVNAHAALRISEDATHAHKAPWPWRAIAWAWLRLAQIIQCHWCASVYVGLVGSNSYLTWATGRMPFVIENGWIAIGWQAETWALWLPGALASSWVIATLADLLDTQNSSGTEL